ncbi:Enoyl-CoA hydratase/carnithine racemase [Archaeoglobus sulfaticallidus PM70-1]|uniref:Enoyl-CoA hydratase domain-containing protein 3, mitochondrial n=1 Tax=Archaeoglobus sulfaticallidus PM70-1 TaxID=387631 RepID=N0BEL6_9EURY|nr:enoyl-CoA hydratase-related protein [Archaeoglobus sulfaticallidus]AGK62064.1 Enoyl-CoA hydratase/carnithine racemase [Archaeoglobus sulfaticallidus PM70-1]
MKREFRNLVYEEKDRIGIITLNRPEKRNALSYDLLDELESLVNDLAAERKVKVVIIKGAGKIFSSGHDLNEILNHPIEVEKLFRKCFSVMLAIRNAPQTYIAQVHGMAAAAGCQLVSACDLAVAEENALFSLPGVKIGLFCSTPVVFVSRAVGRKRAYEMAITGEFITAKQAYEWGLLNKIVPVEELESATMELARKLSGYSFTALESGKRMFYRQIQMEDFLALEYATEVISLQSSSEDAVEGIKAFLEKREPRWKY